jgi:preprotein translocase subunit SecD
MLPAFMFTPLFKWGAGIFGVILLIGGIWLGINHAVSKHDQSIRDQLIQQQQVEALQQAAKQAEQDRKFEQMLSDQRAQDVITLNEVRRANDAAVNSVRNSIRNRIDSGELADRPASPLLVSTAEEIERLRAERMEKAK